MTNSNQKLVSVIVPIYNSEEHIRVCIDSIINQTYHNLEIICVDDGSTDETLNILKSYSDKRIKIFSKQNSGVADTRNYGLDRANGDYICSLDNDDRIDPDFVEYFVKNIGNNDVLIGGYIRESYSGKVLFKRKLNSGIISPYVNLAFWGKLYRGDLLQRNNIRFLKTNIADDLYFSAKLYNCTDKIKVISATKYHWLYNDKSLSNTDSKKMNRTEDLIHTLTKIDCDISFKNSDLKTYFFLRTIVYYLLFSCKGVDYSIVMDNYKRLFDYMISIDPHYKKNKYLGMFNHSGEQFKVKVIIKLFIILQVFKLDKLFLKMYIR